MTVYHCTWTTYRRCQVFFEEVEDRVRQVIDQVIAEKGYDVPSYIV